ncbi:unnamed protein product [Somion occarium]|uniref:Uncharacterized protein n=1 Tax=Somion occarium TaxID=3059160 RepID=A0ABP1E3I3_9APHY
MQPVRHLRARRVRAHVLSSPRLQPRPRSIVAAYGYITQCLLIPHIQQSPVLSVLAARYSGTFLQSPAFSQLTYNSAIHESSPKLRRHKLSYKQLHPCPSLRARASQYLLHSSSRNLSSNSTDVLDVQLS